MIKTHLLKCHSEYFQALARQEKTFEIRKNDRDFKTNDKLVLVEIEPDSEKPSGKMLHVKICYIYEGMGIDEGFVAMAIKLIKDIQQ